MRPKIVASGIATERELDEVDQAVREHLSNPDTLMLPHLLFLAWGRKPAGAATTGENAGPRRYRQDADGYRGLDPGYGSHPRG